MAKWNKAVTDAEEDHLQCRHDELKRQKRVVPATKARFEKHKLSCNIKMAHRITAKKQASSGTEESRANAMK